MKAIIAERGQVTIPKKLRTQLGLKPGTVLDFKLKGATLVAIKSTGHASVESLYGCLKIKDSTDNLIKSLRGEV